MNIYIEKHALVFDFLKVRHHRGTDGQGKQQGLLPLRPLMPVPVREPGAHFRADGGGPIRLLDHAHDWRCGTSFILKKLSLESYCFSRKGSAPGGGRILVNLDRLDWLLCHVRLRNQDQAQVLPERHLP